MIDRLAALTEVQWVLVLAALNAAAVLAWIATRCRLVLARRSRPATPGVTASADAHPDDLALAAAFAYADAGRAAVEPPREQPAAEGAPDDAERRLADDIARFRERALARTRTHVAPGPAPREATR